MLEELAGFIVYINIDQTLRNSLHGLLSCEIAGFDCHVFTTEYRTLVHCIHISHLFCNALVHVIYSGESGQCSHTIQLYVKESFKHNNTEKRSLFQVLYMYDTDNYDVVCGIC